MTDSIRKTPYAVLLLDEIEKAHPDLFNVLLQVMDHATLTDNNGKKADFRNIILIMTTNAGGREMNAAALGFAHNSNVGKGKEAVEKMFSPEFRNRLDATIFFNSLSPAVIEKVVDKFITQLDAQLNERKVTIQLEPAARSWLAERGYDPQFGAAPWPASSTTRSRNAWPTRSCSANSRTAAASASTRRTASWCSSTRGDAASGVGAI